jgi:DNA-binding NarL/FixJ family response regulator
MSAREAGRQGKAGRRILVVDDHPMTRYGITQLLQQEPDLEVCGEAGSARQALSAVEALAPDMVLTDLSMPGQHGLEFIKDMHALHPDMDVLVVSMHDETLFAERVLRAGARGYIMKNEGGEKLVEAVRLVLQGKVYISEPLSSSLLDHFTGRRPSNSGKALGKLTDREFEVFQLIGKGLATREIAQTLHVSIKTVDTHRLHVRQKLKLKSGPELIKHAVQFVSANGLN